MPKVSVVIPVYNAESRIERCLHTLFGQTLDDIEYVFVDDGTPDASVDRIGAILESYPHRKCQTKIVTHRCNRGVAAARADGILAANGDYIIHCDPDDYVERDMYEKLYAEAVGTGADVVACYYWEESPGQKNIVSREYVRSPQDCLENIYRKNRHCSRLWDKLVRRSLVTEHHIVPSEGDDYAEDLYCVAGILYYAASIAVVKEPLYHYCRHRGSITQQPKDYPSWGMRKRVIDKIVAFLGGDSRYEMACRQMEFYAKMEYRAAFVGREEEWFNIYRDSHRFILRYDDMPLKSRMVWWLALQRYVIFKAARKLLLCF